MSMTEMILIMAHNIGVDTLAEGVETEQQAEILSNYGCDYMQGYYFAKPMRLPDLLDLLEEFRDFGPNKD
jgi:EAL domain-containing protein (putative c-di-GMP-specific phosphodiesterase class I)